MENDYNGYPEINRKVLRKFSEYEINCLVGEAFEEEIACSNSLDFLKEFGDKKEENVHD